MNTAEEQASLTTVAREEVGTVFSPEELDRLTPSMITVLSPERVRDALSEAYSAVFSDSTSGRPTPSRVIQRILEPFFGAIPDLVAEHGHNDENLRRFLAEILNIMVGTQRALDRHLPMSALYDRNEDGQPLDEMSIMFHMMAPAVQLRIGQAFAARLTETARLGGIWVALASNEVMSEFNNTDPTSLLNWLMEFRQYASTCSFKVKLEGQQIKMLQAFFRSV